MKKLQWKKTAVGVSALLALGTLFMGGTAMAEEVSASERYQQILTSQGNLSNSPVIASDRYLATSSIKITLDGTDSNRSSGPSSSSSKTSTTSKTSSTPKTSPTPGTTSKQVTTSSSGPGQSQMGHDSSADGRTTGPKVTTITLSEIQHSEYDVYELAMEDTYFLYSNVSNGGITDQPVYVEIPANVQYSMEFNGVGIPYSSGQRVSERGSYALKLTAVLDPSAPVSQQTILKSSFRFRIQEKAVLEEEGDYDTFSGMDGGYGSYPGDDSVPSYDELVRQVEELQNQLLANRHEEGTDGELEAGAEGDDMISGESEGSAEELSEEELSDLISEDGVFNDENIEQAIADAIGVGYEAESLEGFTAATGMASVYDGEAGYYRHELITGAVFYSNVPNGMVTNYSVTLLTDAEDLQLTVLKDGEAVEYEPGAAIEEVGSYMVYPSQESALYVASYAATEKPVFHFRIVGDAVSDLGIFNAPQGARITQVLLNQEPLAMDDGFTGEWCRLEQDGQYVIEMATQSGVAAVSFRKDTVAPRFYYSVGDNSISIQYMTADVAESRIFQDGNMISSGNVVSSISGNGVFEIEVYDAAGNMSKVTAEVPYTMNTAAILAIVLVVLLVVVLIVVIRRMKSQINVI